MNAIHGLFETADNEKKIIIIIMRDWFKRRNFFLEWVLSDLCRVPRKITHTHAGAGAFRFDSANACCRHNRFGTICSGCAVIKFKDAQRRRSGQKFKGQV